MSGVRERTNDGLPAGSGGAGALTGWQETRADVQSMFDATEQLVSQGLSTQVGIDFIPQTEQEGAQ